MLKPNNLSEVGIQDVEKVVNQLRKIIVAGNKENKDVLQRDHMEAQIIHFYTGRVLSIVLIL